MADSSNLIPGTGPLSRRKLLAAFGAAGLSAASASAVTPLSLAPDVSVRTEFRFYGSMAEMKQDKSLKEGYVAKTSGFYEPGDGGSAEYLMVRRNKSLSETETATETYIPLGQDLQAMLINVSSINYQMFGARGRKDNDDGIAIKAAHKYANLMGLPVVNLKGEYWISKTNAIPVATDVNWGKSIFHIDEKYNGTVSRFKIMSRHKAVDIVLSDKEKASLLSKFKPGVSIITELSPYKNMLLHIADANDRIGFRAGKAYAGRISRPREELVYVEEHGRIIGDIAWAFKDYTALVGYPADESYLTVEGGTFYVSGDSPLPHQNGYLANGFQISRSRTIIRNQWVGLEKGKPDVSMNSRNGFYNFYKVFDVLLENVRLLPWEKDRPDKDKVVDQGTYGISGSYMLNVVFRNITAEGSAQHWGVFGTNLNKNFRIEYCKLNRVDVHFHCWHLYISHSEIGFRGLTVTGGGDLFVENTKVHSNHFISFRKDYGGKWSGGINIRNCRLIPPLARTTALLAFPSEDFGYGYSIGYARKIKIEDFIVDYSNIPDSKAIGWLILGADTRSVTASGRLFFPYLAEFRNILVEGREMGLRLMELPDFKFFQMQDKSLYNGVDIQPNSRLVFDGVQLEKIEDPAAALSGAHILLSGSNQKQDTYTLIPLIQFKNCHNLVGSFAGNTADLQFENCTINRLTTEGKTAFLGNIRFNNCKFKPLLLKPEAPYALSSTLGTSFTNCIIHLPQMKGENRPELFHLLDFIEINKKLRYNHLNTRLGIDVLNYYKSKSIVLNLKFINMLQSRHELEPEYI